MPEFIVTNPEGKRFKINAPDGATQEQALEYAKTQFSSQESAKETANEAPIMAQVGRGMMDVYQGGAQLALNIGDKINDIDKKLDERFSKGTFQNVAAKLAFDTLSMLTGLGPLRNLGKMTPEGSADQYNKQVSQELELYEKNNPDFQLARMAGGMATPLTFIPGAKAASFGGKVGTGVLTGSAFSLLQPANDPNNYFTQKLEQALFGAAVGGAIPVAGKAFGVLKDWVDELTKPLYKSGVYRDVSKFLKETITENKDKIVKELSKAIKSGDKRTVGQILADATKDSSDDFGGMIVRLEKDLARESDSLKSLYAMQSGARREFIDSLAGTDDDLAKLISKRAATGEQNYQRAFQQKVGIDDTLKNILDNKFARTAMREAKDIAEAQDTTSITEILHNVKIGLDKQLSKSGDDALSSAQKKAVDKVKSRLIKWLEEKNPLYKSARLQYQADSLPINRMQVGRELKDSLVSALDADRPLVFANAVKDSHKVLKKVNGMDRFKKLEDIFSPEEVSKLKSTAKELAIEARASKMASSSKPVIQDIASEVELRLPHILSRPVVITNHFLSRLGQDKSKEYKQLLVSLMKDPKEFVKAYGGPSTSKRTQYAMDIARRLSTLSASQESARGINTLTMEQ